MSTSVPPRDGGAFTESPGSPTPLLGDEAALRRAFDLEYSACVTSARSQLGEAESHAPRVVEAAFVNAWKQRASIADTEQLKAFLDAEVHRGASRALSRRAAAHRFGTHGGREEMRVAAHDGASSTTDAERSWAEIDRALHDTGPTTDAHAAAASAGRHEAAEHMKSVGKRGSWKVTVAVGIVAVAVAAIAVVYLDRLSEGEAALSAFNTASIQPITSTSGQIGSTTLADGSKMRMGPETKVYIADGFPTKLRAVKVDGTAQFDVAPNQPLPLRVVVKKAQVVATGTSFVVSAYPNDSGFMVLVREGSVTVAAGKVSKVLTANQGAMVNGSDIQSLTEAQRAEGFGWVDGHVTVTNKPLRDVVSQLTRWFNLDIKVPNLTLLDRNASFAVSLDSSRLAIAQVEKSAGVTFAYVGETKVFRDAAKAPSRK
jgi:ferric-dicitrate binding protein FerR (iron transport regulator)